MAQAYGQVKALAPIYPERVAHDFLTLTSFPSSLLLENVHEEASYVWPTIAENVPVEGGKPLRVEVCAKQIDPSAFHSGVRVDAWTGTKWYYDVGWVEFYGTFDWKKFSVTGSTSYPTVPADARVLKVMVFALGTKGKKTWFDDLKIYQDDVPIYSNDFGNWDPLIGAGVGAPIGGVAGYLLKEPLGPMVSEVVGAVVGGALGGGIGLLTGLGIIPVPQIPIPMFGAAPEEPGAPAQLGKYLITG